ncbi:MAG: hypothetical protein WCR07_16215 [Verrucomicrobiota bacterium]|jgi:hypothetical protein
MSMEGQQEGWGESGDVSFADYKRVRSQIEHEDTLINHRMTWLVTCHAFMFGGFALTISAISKGGIVSDVNVDADRLAYAMFTVLPVFGLAVCGITLVLVDAALCQIRDLHEWWKARIHGAPPDGHPPMIGAEGIQRHRLLLAWGIPSLLACCWIVILACLHKVWLLRVWPRVKVEVFVGLLVLVGVLIFLLGALYGRVKREQR